MTNITYDKPFKTYSEQIALMESRNIIFDDYDFARKVLSSLSYYTLVNGYKNTFLSVAGTDNFVEGTNFNDLYTLHIINANLNSILLKNILFVERYLKTKIAYVVSQNYGVYTDTADPYNRNPNDYLYRNNYSRSAKGRNNILYKIKDSLNGPGINDSITHYANHKNHIPAWILVTNLTFGLTIKWYNILKSTDKERICSEFIPSDAISAQDKKEFIAVALSLTKEYRNKIAHGNRTFNVTNLPVLPKHQLITLSCSALSEEEYNKGIGKNDLFAIILTCFVLLDDRYILFNFLRDLQYTLDPYDGITMNGKDIYQILKLPKDIFARLIKIIEKK